MYTVSQASGKIKATATVAAEANRALYIQAKAAMRERATLLNSLARDCWAIAQDYEELAGDADTVIARRMRDTANRYYAEGNGHHHDACELTNALPETFRTEAQAELVLVWMKHLEEVAWQNLQKNASESYTSGLPIAS